MERAGGRAGEVGGCMRVRVCVRGWTGGRVVRWVDGCASG